MGALRRQTWVRGLLVTFISIAILGDAQAQQEDPTRVDRDAALRALGRTAEDVPKKAATEAPGNLPVHVTQAYHQALIASYVQDQWSYEFRQRIYEWQFLSSRIVFCVVILIVLIGLYFSWLQFKVFLIAAGAKQPAKVAIQAEDPQEVPAPIHQVEITPTGGLRISTPVMGIVILAISLGFFYLYLSVVYPIT